MEKTARAQLKNLRIAPRKVRLVADLMRGKNAEDAERLLRLTPNASALPMAKVLKSAIANASQIFSVGAADLYVARLLVNEGTKLKRFMPRSRGQASPIQKKTSHILLELGLRANATSLNMPDAKQKKSSETERKKEETKSRRTPKRLARMTSMKKEDAKTGKPSTILKRMFRRKSI